MYKITQETVWENPITGEKETVTVEGCATDYQKEQYKSLGINLDEDLNHAIDSEIKRTLTIKNLYVIEHYAIENDCVIEKTLDESKDLEYKSVMISEFIREICFDYTSPIITTNFYIGCLIQETEHFNLSTEVDPTNPINEIGKFRFNYKDDEGYDFQVIAPIYVDAYMPSVKTEVLIYEKHNPKKCTLIKFDKVVSL